MAKEKLKKQRDRGELREDEVTVRIISFEEVEVVFRWEGDNYYAVANGVIQDNDIKEICV